MYISLNLLLFSDMIFNSLFNIPSLDCNIVELESKASWCAKKVDLRNICDGTKMDCITKAESLCQDDSNCFGFMWNSGWGSGYKGVMKCTSLELTAKPGKDWEIYLKICDTGIDSVATFDLEIGILFP